MNDTEQKTYRVLVGWSNVPDGFGFIEFKDISKDEFNLLNSFNAQYINSTSISNEMTNKMMTFFFKNGYMKYELWNKIFTGTYDSIIHCGFYL